MVEKSYKFNLIVNYVFVGVFSEKLNWEIFVFLVYAKLLGNEINYFSDIILLWLK